MSVVWQHLAQKQSSTRSKWRLSLALSSRISLYQKPQNTEPSKSHSNLNLSMNKEEFNLLYQQCKKMA